MIKGTLACIAGTFAFAVILKVPRRFLGYVTAGGVVSAVIYEFMNFYGYSTFKSIFLAMIAVEIYAEIMARILKTPSTVILLPSTIPLLPGGSIYYTLFYLINGNTDLFIQFGKETVLTGVGMGLGAVTVSIFIKLIFAMIRRNSDNP